MTDIENRPPMFDDLLSVAPASSSSSSKVTKKRSVEETYQQTTQRDHILLRPDTYIGAIESEQDKVWVVDGSGTEAEPWRMVYRDVSYVPGLYKIFDEILVNAADNKQRDPSMNELRVEIDRANNRISVYNNGMGIPIQIHQEYKGYVS